MSRDQVMARATGARRAGDVVGVDIGGTKTHVVVQDSGGVDRLEAVVPTASWKQTPRLGDPADVDRLLAVFGDRLGDAATATLVVGSHGCDTQRQVDVLRGALAHRHAGPVKVVNDAQLLPPAAGHREGIALISGTGSIVVGQDADGGVVSAGGHGWLLADPGSAPALAREAMAKVLDRYDRTRALDALGQSFLRHLGGDDVHDLCERFTVRASMETWGAMAPLVFQAADAGSADAAAVVDEAGLALARSVRAVVDRGARGDVVVAAGGVVTRQPLLQQSIRRHVAALVPGMGVDVLVTPPVRGAIALGHSMQRDPATSAASAATT